MTDTVKKRRRWPWLVLAALLLIGGPVAWRFRPLNQTERGLIGRWRHEKQLLDFTSDRRWWARGGTSNIRGVDGSWSASESSICMTKYIPGSLLRHFPWTSRIRLALETMLSRPSVELRWSGPDRVWIQGVEYVRVADSDSPAL